MRLNPKAFGIAGGAVAAGAVFVGTLVTLLSAGEVTAPPLLSSVLFGYSVSPAGAFIGAMWAYVYGFFGGGCLPSCTIWRRLLRTRRRSYEPPDV